ncbi:MAG: hypothetical protein HQL75_16900 [Magnetococcales bacterium]|nr:hypothetical protein [Magnetococcales bacterium]
MTAHQPLDHRLQSIHDQAWANISDSVIMDQSIRDMVDYVCRNLSNRACVRLLMSCLLGKIENPSIDPRKPYTEIGTDDSFSGRTLDERYLTAFITKHHLPCNATTAFLTPTLRNINRPLMPDVDLVGRPRELYVKTLQLLDEVASGRMDAENLFVETVRVLLIMRDEKMARMQSLMDSLKRTEGNRSPPPLFWDRKNDQSWEATSLLKWPSQPTKAAPPRPSYA